MPWLHHLSKELLVRVLDLSSDKSVLELTAASRAVKTEVEECRPLGSEGSWRHPEGTWNMSGIWRFLGLGDLKSIPSVTLYCEVEFQNVVEALTFLKAAKNLAAETIDGQVSFSKCFFEAEDVSDLFEAVQNPENPEELQFDCEATWCSAVKPFRMFAFADERFESPWINISIEKLPEETDKLPERIALCVNSLLLPGLRLLAETEDKDDGVVINYDLDGQSPLTEYVLNSRPLPMFFGFKQLTAQAST